MAETPPDAQQLNTIFQPCRQCGTCCKKYRKIALEPDEIDFIKKMGGYVGFDIPLNNLRDNSLEQLVRNAEKRGQVFMVHPDEKGCVFLEKRNGKYFCKIYHYRPKRCRSFKCNMADRTFFDLFAGEEILLRNADQGALSQTNVTVNNGMLPDK